MAAFKAALSVLLAAFVTLVAAQESNQLNDVLPPNWFPGDVLDSTEHPRIEKALEDVDKAGGILDTRAVAIGVASMTGVLSNPQYHLLDGQVHGNTPFNISAGQTGLLYFTKTHLGVKGVYGVVTYDVADKPLRLAVMFNVPFNTVTYKQTFHFRVFRSSTPVDKAMVRQMYECSGAWSAKGYQEKTEYGIHMRGTMTDNTRSRLIVWVNTTNADINEGPTLNAFCDYKGIVGIGSYRCRQARPSGVCANRGLLD